MEDASPYRLEVNEARTREKPGRDELFCHEATRAVGLTGLMGGVYAEALDVHQVLAGQSEAKRTEPGPDTKACIN